MKKLAGAILAASLAVGAQAATLKMAYDSDPVSLDPHEQLSGATSNGWVEQSQLRWMFGLLLPPTKILKA